MLLVNAIDSVYWDATSSSSFHSLFTVAPSAIAAFQGAVTNFTGVVMNRTSERGVVGSLPKGLLVEGPHSHNISMYKRVISRPSDLSTRFFS